MAKVEYIDILPGLDSPYFSNLRFGDRFVHSRVVKKISIFSKKNIKGITARSLLPAISDLWAGLSGAEKSAWSDAAAAQKNIYSGGDIIVDNAFFAFATFGVAHFGRFPASFFANGWRLFVQDCSARIKNDMSGVATPSLLHQSWVGNLKIEAPASELKIVQIHPRSYWISKKVVGKKGMYEPILITEDLALPLKISLNYSSNLTETAAGSFAKFYARVWYSYQGVNLYNDLEIPLDYISDWKNAEITLTTLASIVIRVDLYFHLFNLQGNLYFDNINLEHSGQNWARDPFCKDILQGFTRAYYQIPDHWAAVILPVGSIYDSIYKDF